MKKNSWLSNDAAYFSFWEIPLRQIWTCSFITPGNFPYIILCLWPKPPHFSVTNLNNKALDVVQWVSACCASMCEHDYQCLDPLKLCETQVQQCMFGAPGQAGKNKSIWGVCEPTREAVSKKEIWKAIKDDSWYWPLAYRHKRTKWTTYRVPKFMGIHGYSTQYLLHQD